MSEGGKVREGAQEGGLQTLRARAFLEGSGDLLSSSLIEL